MRGGEPLRKEEAGEGIVHLVLDRPEKRNALNGALVEALGAALRTAAGDPEVRVVVLRGAGRDFCSGADLAELEAAADRGPEASLDDADGLGRLLLAIRGHPTPVLAAVRGRALAGGCGLAAACDLIVAEEGSEFGFPEVHLGFVPAMVMALLRRKVPEPAAFELVTLGRRISAEEARERGLVSRVCPPGALADAVGELAGELAARPPSAIRLTKRLLYGLDGLPVEEGIRRGAEMNALVRLTGASREGVRRFLDRAARRRPEAPEPEKGGS